MVKYTTITEKFEKLNGDVVEFTKFFKDSVCKKILMESSGMIDAVTPWVASCKISIQQYEELKKTLKKIS